MVTRFPSVFSVKEAVKNTPRNWLFSDNMSGTQRFSQPSQRRPIGTCDLRLSLFSGQENNRSSPVHRKTVTPIQLSDYYGSTARCFHTRLTRDTVLTFKLVRSSPVDRKAVLTYSLKLSTTKDPLTGVHNTFKWRY